MNELIQQSMHDSDQWVIEFSYLDANGRKTRRVVSPIRMLGLNRFLGFCLSREQPRQFCLDRCQQMKLMPASDYLMPVELAVVN